MGESLCGFGTDQARPSCPPCSGPSANVSVNVSASRSSAELVLREVFRREGLLFLRIQKTAGTTFDRVLQTECPAAGAPVCGAYWHLEHNMITRNAKGRLIVTWLRDPVERLASEFAYIQRMPEYQWQQPQWDYPPELQSLLHLWRSPPEGTTGEELGPSVSSFAQIPRNPAKNRQALYLLGFDRPNIFDCDEVRVFGGTWSRWTAFRHAGGLDPGAALELALQQLGMAELLAVAQSRLEKEIHLFGIADCFEASLALFSHTLGWDVHRANEVAAVRYRANGSDLPSQSASPWRSRLPAAAVEAIEAASSLDLALHKFAKGLLNRRLRLAGLKETCD